MEENNNKNLEKFVHYISQKYNLNEGILIDNLKTDLKNFWNVLFELINKKSELNITTSVKNIDNNDNNIVLNENFNKKELEKDIDNYFSENPDENKEIWNKYKNDNIDSEKINKSKFDLISPTSSSTEKKIELKNNKLKRISSQKRKKSLFVKNNQKYNITIGVSKNRRHQSIYAQIKTLNDIDLNKSLSKINTIKKKNSKSIKNKNNYVNNNRKSLFLKFDNNTAFEYNVSKKKFLPVKNRKSVLAPQNNFKFNYYLNNFNDKKIIGSSKGKKGKSCFNKKEKEIINNKDENKNDNKDENKDENIIIDCDEKSLENYNKDETIKSDNEFIEKESKNILNKINNKNDKEKLLHNYINDNDFSNSTKKQKSKIKDDIIPIYKNKNTILTIKKPKLKIKPKLKKYINNIICHQISIFLKPCIHKISNSKINKENNKNIDIKYEKIKKSSNNNIKNIDNDFIEDYYLKLLNNKKTDKKELKKTEHRIDTEINKNKYSDTSYKKRNKKTIIKNIKFTHPTIKIFDDTIYKKQYNYKSQNNILNTYNNEHDKEIYNSQKTLPKNSEIKYNKFSETNNNYKYKNKNNRYDINRLLKEIENKNRSERKEYRKNKNIIKKNKITTNNNKNNTSSKKKNYFESYKEAIENIMKDDYSIFNDENDILYIKKDKKKIMKNDINNEIGKSKDIKSKERLIENKNGIIKKTYYGSCDNIHQKI